MTKFFAQFMVITNYYRQCGNGKFPQSWKPRMRIFNTINLFYCLLRNLRVYLRVQRGNFNCLFQCANQSEKWASDGL